MREIYENVPMEADCPFSRGKASHPLVEKLGKYYVCRHCGHKTAIRPPQELQLT